MKVPASQFFQESILLLSNTERSSSNQKESDNETNMDDRKAICIRIRNGYLKYTLKDK